MSLTERSPLVSVLEQKIRSSGPIAFSDFFKASNDAYYKRSLIGASNAGDGTDFTTPSEDSPLFNYATARQIAEIQKRLGVPWPEFTLAEVGAGNATFMREALSYLLVRRQATPQALIIEQSPHLARIQRRRLEAYKDRLTIIQADASGENFGYHQPPIRGVLMFLEVISDIFPPEIVRRHGNRTEQLFVDLGDNTTFEPVWKDPERQVTPPSRLSEGETVAIRPSLQEFGRYAKAVIQKGAIIIIDYDHNRGKKGKIPIRLFGPKNLLPTATDQLDPVNTFRKDLVGQVNPTAGLDFDTLEQSARKHGLTVEGKKGENVRIDGWLFSLEADLLERIGDLNGLSVRRVNPMRESSMLREHGWKVSVISVNTPTLNPTGLQNERNSDPDWS